MVSIYWSLLCKIHLKLHRPNFFQLKEESQIKISVFLTKKNAVLNLDMKNFLACQISV